MEASTPLDNDFGHENLTLSADIRSFLKETAQWAKLIAIAGFVCLGIMIIMALLTGTLMGSFFNILPESNSSPFPISGMSAFVSIFYFLIALLYFFPILYLYRFSVKMQRALKTDDQAFLIEACSNLKSHYKFIGIFLMVILGLFALAFIASLF